MKRVLGVDVDGVLAWFDAAYSQLLITVTGKDLFPAERPIPIPCWDWSQHYGYTADDDSACWEVIKQDPLFWQNLADLPGTREALTYLRGQIQLGDDVYFITNRPGNTSKVQTERWLRKRGIGTPTVIVAAGKGLVARALRLDVYIDDKWENCKDVAISSPRTRMLMFNQPWNQGFTPEDYGIVPVDTVVGMAEYANSGVTLSV